MKLSYDSISPFTGNAAVLEEPVSRDVTLMLCMDTGYHTYKGWLTPDSDAMIEFETNMADSSKNSKKIADGLVWYYYAITDMDNCVSLIPNIKSDNVEWHVVRLKPRTVDSEVTFASFKNPETSETIDYVYDPNFRSSFESFTDAIDLYSSMVYKTEKLRERAKLESK
jgi:hypothetical protein